MILRYVYDEKTHLYKKKLIDGLIPVEIFSPSVVDFSDWRPNIDTVSTLDLRGSNRTPLYDYPDGKDSGLDLTYLRSPSRDITEIDEMKNKLSKSVDSGMKELNEAIKEELTIQSEETPQSFQSSKTE